MQEIKIGKFVFELVADRVKECPHGAGRSSIARDFGISKSTALAHLEKCVSRGLLVKFYGWLGKRSRGWVYIDPAAMQEMAHVEQFDQEEGNHVNS